MHGPFSGGPAACFNVCQIFYEGIALIGYKVLKVKSFNIGKLRTKHTYLN